jgi:hypothetical protein
MHAAFFIGYFLRTEKNNVSRGTSGPGEVSYTCILVFKSTKTDNDAPDKDRANDASVYVI